MSYTRLLALSLTLLVLGAAPLCAQPPTPGAAFAKGIAAGSPLPPTLNQTFSYYLALSNAGNVPLDEVFVVDFLPIEMVLSSVTTGTYSNLGNFAPGVGVQVSYYTSTAPGTPTILGTSPDTTTNTTLPAPALAPGEYVIALRWEYGQAAVGMQTLVRPLITGQFVNPDNAGGPVAFGDIIENCAFFSAVYTAGNADVDRSDCRPFALSGPFVLFDPTKESLSGPGPFAPGESVSWRLRVSSTVQSSDPAPLADLIVSDLLPDGLAFAAWSFDDQGTGLPAPQVFEQLPNFAGTGRTLLRWRWQAGSGSLAVGQHVNIDLETTIGIGVPPGSVGNIFKLDNDTPGLQLRCAGQLDPDVFDVDGDADTSEGLCAGGVAVAIGAVAPIPTLDRAGLLLLVLLLVAVALRQLLRARRATP